MVYKVNLKLTLKLLIRNGGLQDNALISFLNMSVAGIMTAMIAAHADRLADPNPSIQSSGSSAFKSSILSSARDLTPKSFTSFVKNQEESALKLIEEGKGREMIVGICVLDCLLEVKDEDLIKRRRDFGNQLRSVIKNSSTHSVPVITTACRALGHFARIASTTDIEFVEEHFLKQTRDWIKDGKSEMRRLTAVCILRQLLVEAPALFYSKKEATLNDLNEAVRDSKPTIRAKASETLGTFLMFVHQREHEVKYYEDCLKFAESGLASSNENHVHGSLLVLMQLLNHPTMLEASDTDTKLSHSLAKTLRDSMNKNFKQFAQCIITEKKNSPSAVIQGAVIELIPVLAKFDTSLENSQAKSTFMNSCLGPSVDFLIGSVNSENNVDVAYKSLGNLSITLGRRIPKQMQDQIIEIIFSCFTGDSLDRFCESALEALGMVVRSMKGKNTSKKLSNELVFLVPSLFKGGLTHNLIMTLDVICENIEEARGVIQSRLFSEVDSVLRNHTFQDLVTSGAPTSPNSHQMRRANSSARPASQSLFQRPADIASVLTSAFATTSKLVGSHIMDLVAPTDQESQLVVLALHTLHTFDFYTKHQQGAHQVLKTIKESVINCLDDDDKYIRKSATVTCCKILHNSLDEKSELRKARRVSSNTENTVLEVLERLLMVGVADDIEEIRLAVFQSISPRLDPYVAKSENLNCLLDAINDESVQVCSSAMGVIARLAYHSPSVIMPQLRKILVQLLRQLEHNDDTRLLENSIVLLTELIKGANLLLKPYIEAILSPLLMQLELEEVDAFAVAAIGELSMVDSACIVPHVDVLLSKIIKLIDEKGAAKKQTMALRALGQIVGTTGCVITPYLSHPDLLDGIISIIQKSDSVSHELRCEATRAFGILGVADPNKLKAMHRRLLETAQHNGNDYSFSDGNGVNNTSGGVLSSAMSVPANSNLSGEEVTDIQKYLEALGTSSKMLAVHGAQQHTNAALLARQNRQRMYQHEHSHSSGHGHGHHHHHGAGHRNPHNQYHRLMNRSGSTSSNYGGGAGGGDVSWTYNTHKQSSHLIAYHQSEENTLDKHALFSTPMELTDFYPSITLASLISILRDPILRSHHTTTVQVLKKVVGMVKSNVVLVDELVECCIDGINADDKTLASDIFDLLKLLVENVGEGLQSYHGSIVEAVEDFWWSDDSGSKDLDQVLLLVGSLHSTLSTDLFTPLLPALLPPLLSILSDSYTNINKRLSVISTLSKIGSSLGEYTRNVVPVLVRVLDRAVTSERASLSSSHLSELTTTLLTSLNYITGLNLSHAQQFSSRVIWCLVKIVTTSSASSESQNMAMDCLSNMVCRLGQGYIPYILPVRASLRQVSVEAGRDNVYHSLVMKAVRGKTMPTGPVIKIPEAWEGGGVDREREVGAKDRHISEDGLKNLRQAWDVTGRKTSGDWLEWMRRFSLELLRQSPSPIIYSCQNLAEVYQPLSHELLNAAFMSVWVELSPVEVSVFELTEDALDLARSLEAAIEAQNMPTEVLTDLLSMIEFVELHDKKLPIDVIKIGTQSRKAHHMAKALRCKEIEFSTRPNSVCIEALIGINNLLGLDDAAKGILNCIGQDGGVTDGNRCVGDPVSQAWEASPGQDGVVGSTLSLPAIANKRRVKKTEATDIKVMPSWQEKLGNWEEALKLYEAEGYSGMQEGTTEEEDGYADEESREDQMISSKLGELRCHAALDNSDIVLEECKELWSKVDALKKRDEEESEATSPRSSTLMKQQRAQKLEKWITEVEVLGAKAAWILGKWSDLQDYVGRGRLGTAETGDLDDITTYFSAVLHINENQIDKAQEEIDKAREKIIPMLSSMLGDFSYSRAHKCLVTVQQLSELEEIISHKKLVDNLALAGVAGRDEAKIQEKLSLEKLRSKWDKRMEWIPQEPELWRQMLTMRSLVLNPVDDLDAWIKYEKMCRRSGHHALCHSALKRLGVEDLMAELLKEGSSGHDRSRTLSVELEDRTSLLKVNPIHSPLKMLRKEESMMAMGGAGGEGGVAEVEEEVKRFSIRGGATLSEASASVNPRVMYSIYKFMWAKASGKDSKKTALSGLEKYCGTLEERHRAANDKGNYKDEHSTKQLLGRCILKVAKWSVMTHEEENKEVPWEKIIGLQKEATELRPNYYKAWHSWALMNYQSVQNGGKDKDKQNANASAHVVDAVRGFFKSLELGKSRPMGDILQDTLRLLTIWFNNGDNDKLNDEMEKGLREVSVDTWLVVIPQLIARIHTQYPRVNQLLHDLLCRVGQVHPQALIYPVTVASKTSSQRRREAATAIIEEMKKSDQALVDEANLVSQEVIKLSITWHEAWHEGLEEASRLFFGEKKVEDMFSILTDLHAELDKATSMQETKFGFSSVRNISFLHCYGSDLEQANEWLLSFKKSRRMGDIHQAWALYYQIFRRITKQLNQLEKIELQHVSPLLLNAKGLKLAVPGTYRAHAPIVQIEAFSNSMDVIVSKQRPRKMTIQGSDGVDYPFLLKGHEDLRQDERVMQLFGLINALLAQDRTASKSKTPMSIRTYSVMPLSNNSGVIGWVPECDTLHSLVKQYREARQIRLNIEHKLMAQFSNGCYDKLPLMGKMEVFERTRMQTKGEELAKMLFLRSNSSEIWLGRRTNYTKSCAVTSIAGYILGLGDRHPNNLMIDKNSGKIVHIDFGDCWEVCQTRSKFPENVPFRLTRMMTQAMEVAGLKGSFRSDAEAVMRCLRENRDSVTAMLEAFVHDPLISWRLLAEAEAGGDGGGVRSSGGALEKEKSKRRMSKMSAIFRSSNDLGDAVEVEEPVDAEQLNEQASRTLDRIDQKLKGTDFGECRVLNVEEQVDKLIRQATSTANLAVLFQGWCSFW
ncbi:hypothetical protein TL16_g07704 [Triparma laevis f. inornata]|uniref:Serine/threonine-protein kinase TOR n=1 Tax=Triparma laevis f. inornata TaxID=1714386 RepID=A0A9W7EEE7_9STRA|nr:hypothetical protein TL16_g07704 [Triparma laevis f. inornata]